MKLSQIKKNPKNPRLIKDDKFEKLKRSLQDFPQMMALRPIIVDEQGVILGGNMRFEALKALGFKEVPDEWVKRAADLTEEQKQEFIIKDNVGFGENDWDVLANEWSELPLAEWGLDVPVFDNKSDYALIEDDAITDSQPSDPISGDKYPLAIVVERKLKNEWEDFKIAESLHTDSQAFLFLWQQHKQKSAATA